MVLSENKRTILLILAAFIFSFAVRLIWVDQFSNTEQFKFNGEFMINTNDGYYWAEGARDILAGSHQENDSSPVVSSTSQLTALIVKILPIPFETVILYMPAFFSSLIVIPIILIGRSFHRLEVGFIAALVGSIAWSYYNRTMVGYYDTDFLNIVFPTFLLWSLIWAIRTGEDKYLIITALEMIAYRWWYSASYSLEFAFFGLVLLYVIYQYIKKEDYKFNLLLVSFMIFSMMGLDGYIRLAIVVLLFGAVKFNKELVYKYLIYIFGVALVLFLISGGVDPIWAQLKGYVFKDSTLVFEGNLNLHFFSVMQTVREAGQIPFETFANRISGHTITLIFAVIGYIWLAFKYRVMLIALPMVGLGFLALHGGLRFTVYAVPIMALGIAFLVSEVSKWLSSQLINDMAAKVSNYVLLGVFTLAILYPNVKHVIEYRVPTVFNANEVQILDQLKKAADREDYVVTWWDYGYPIRYYSDVKTLIDGGKHNGSVNFPVSYILNAPQDLAVKMARLDVEYTEKRFKLDENTKWADSNIEQMTLDYGYKNTNDFLSSLGTDMKLPEKTRDIYLYLPNRMLNIFPTVTLFSNIDLMTGTKGTRPFFYKSSSIKNQGDVIHLGNGVSIFKSKGKLKVGKQTLNINNFALTSYNKKGQLVKRVQTIDRNAPLSVIYMQNYNTMLVLDKKMYDSSFIQLFVLENYSKDLLEPVILNPLTKIYKLKI